MVGNYRYWSGSLEAFPAWGGGKLASGNYSTAAGGPQITRTTWWDYSGFGITAFDPVSQATFAWKLGQARFGLAHPSQSLLSVLQGPSSGLVQIPAYLGATWPGGCDSGFPKRYAANLAALQAPAPTPTPTPTPTPPPPPSSDTYTGKLTDSSGRSLPVSITIGTAGTLAAMVLATAIAMAPKPPDAAQAQIPQQQEVVTFRVWHPEPMRWLVKPAFDFSGSTFAFDRNLRPVPTASGMGR